MKYTVDRSRSTFGCFMMVYSLLEITSTKSGAATSNPTVAANPFLDALRQRNNTQPTSGEAPKRNATPEAENPFKSIIEKK